MMALGALAPRLALAQAAKLPLVAVLFLGDTEDEERAAKDFFEAMEKSGWIEGKTIAYERHSSKGTRPYLETMASNAAGSEPNLILHPRACHGGGEENAAAAGVRHHERPGGGRLRAKKPARNATAPTRCRATPMRFAYVAGDPGLKRMARCSPQRVRTTASAVPTTRRPRARARHRAREHEFTNFEAIARSARS
jgi:hypothetical protein